jgi:hypothetical protein
MERSLSNCVYRPSHIELAHDSRFSRRIVRLAATSIVALGIIWWFAKTTVDAPSAVGLALLTGWLLMPTVLIASLRLPLLRYALVVPSSLVGIALTAVCLSTAGTGGAAMWGWRLVCAGVWFGALLGAWFWFRLLPVRSPLIDPFSPHRLLLVGVHIALIVFGLMVVGLDALL